MNPREAEAIVSLIKAMTQHPAYEGKTIGVISMVKEEQALLIQSLLHKRIDSVELERRRILAGISAEFQGDERDIMLLSLVDSSPEDATLRTVRRARTSWSRNVTTLPRVAREISCGWCIRSCGPARSAGQHGPAVQHARGSGIDAACIGSCRCAAGVTSEQVGQRRRAKIA